MKLRPSRKVPVLIVAVGMSLAGSLGLRAQSAPAGEAQFLAENAAAMDRMMAGMNIAPTGDPDSDFAAMMIPHHQGAIDMAVGLAP